VLHSEITLRHDAEAGGAAATDGQTRTAQLFDHFKRRVFTDRLKLVVRSLKAQRIKRVTVYGAGDVGRALIALLREQGITVNRLADRDQALWGTSVDGITVEPITACLNDRSPVIVLASLSHAAAMRRSVVEALRGKRGLHIVAPRPWTLA
jgi:glutamate dehydrogenase/leucine dehydrogenase